MENKRKKIEKRKAHAFPDKINDNEINLNSIADVEDHLYIVL